MNFLLLSALDFRTPRKANMHFIAEQLAMRGPTRFFSLRYSALSRLKHDARAFLDARANRIERHEGVDCYLHKTFLHPFNTRFPTLKTIEDLWFRWAMKRPSPVLVRWIEEADVIFFESGSAILSIALARSINPNARMIYVASDDLDTIHVAAFVKAEFQRVAAGLDAICLPSAKLADNMPVTSNLYFVPHGLDPDIATKADPSPYRTPLNAVSVGSMLFDRSFFELAGAAMPEMTFHVIGAGITDRNGFPSNVRIYDEMPYQETLRYIKHARIGIAPYIADVIPPYLADTSMKLMQYRFFGVPAVCPESVTGGSADRFGYVPRSAQSIADALRRSLAAPRTAAARVPSWTEVVAQLIDPEQFESARLERVDA